MSGMSTRESHFELETLLPITKSGMRWIRLCGLWVDVWPWLIISLGSAIAGTILKSIAPQWIQMPIGLVWLIQLHSVLSAIGVWGLGMLLMTIRDAGDKRWIAYPLVIVWVFATIFVFIDRSWQQFHQIDSLDLFTALCPGVIGLFLVSIAWFRYPDMEWGNQATK